MRVEKSRLKGDAQRLVRTLSNPHSPPEVIADALRQISKMGVFPGNGALYEAVRSNPRLTMEAGKIVHTVESDTAATLVELARAAVSSQLEKPRFTLDKRIAVRRPTAPKIETGIEVAQLLDSTTRPAERAAKLVDHPRIALAQLALADNISAAKIADDLKGSWPEFTAFVPSTDASYIARHTEVAGQPISIVRREQEVAKLGRRVLLGQPGKTPEVYGHGVTVMERQYSAIAPEWAREYLPSDLYSAAGGLTLSEPLEELEMLLAANDPTVAVRAGDAVWLHQQVQPGRV